MTLCMRVVGQYRDDFTGLLPSEISTGLPWLLVNYPEIDVPRSTRAAGETGAIQEASTAWRRLSLCEKNRNNS